MKLLTDRIQKDGKMLPGGIVKVDGFLNHRIDIPFVQKLGEEFFLYFGKKNITMILTAEASGIGIAAIVATYFNVPVVFAKKQQSSNIVSEEGLFTAKVHSYTKGNDNILRVDKRYIGPDDRVLIVDDFLAMGESIKGLSDIVAQSGATLVGAGICVEKTFQPGGKMARDMGIDVLSLAKIGLDSCGNMVFED